MIATSRLIIVSLVILQIACGGRAPIQINHWNIDTGLSLSNPVKVLLISDVHYRYKDTASTVLSELTNIADLTDPDLILLGGDFTGDNATTTDHTRSLIINGLEPLSKRAPTYVVLGNHEVYTNREGWLSGLSRSALEVVEGLISVSSVGGVNVCIRGLGDAFSGHYNHVPFDSECTGIRLTLTHDPHAIQLDPEDGIYFAGHTHCGQIRLPFIPPFWTPTGASEEYWCGYGIDGDKQWVTSSGVGTTAIDIRIGTISSVELVELF